MLYFIEQLLELTYQQEVEIDSLEGLGTIEEIQIMKDSIENIAICKEVYNNLFDKERLTTWRAKITWTAKNLNK